MTWPTDGSRPPPDAIVPDGYRLSTRVDQGEFFRIQSAIGWEMRPGQWDDLMATLVPNAMILARHLATDAPVAVACGTRPGGHAAELGWVAVVPEHRGRGLGRTVCSAVTRQLLLQGYDHVRLSTQDHRLAALRIYVALGYEPVIDRDSEARWREAYRALGVDPARLRGNRS